MLNRFWRSVWPPLLWTLTIFVLMILPGEDLPDDGIFGMPDFDKLVHFGFFFGFVWLWNNWNRGRYKTSTTSHTSLFVIFLLACAYGIGMEYFQKHFTGRSFDIRDIYADSAGALAGWLFSFFGKKISPYRNRGRNQN